MTGVVKEFLRVTVTVAGANAEIDVVTGVAVVLFTISNDLASTAPSELRDDFPVVFR